MKTLIRSIAVTVVLSVVVACKPCYGIDGTKLLAGKQVMDIPGRSAEKITQDLASKECAIAVQADVTQGQRKILEMDKIGEEAVSQIKPLLDLPAGPQEVNTELLRKIGYAKPEEAGQAPVFKPEIITDEKNTGNNPSENKDQGNLVSRHPSASGNGNALYVSVSMVEQKIDDKIEQPKEKVTETAPSLNLPAVPRGIDPELLRRLGYAKPKKPGQAPVFKPEIQIEEPETIESNKDNDAGWVRLPVRRPYYFGGGATMICTMTQSIENQDVQ